MELRFEVITEAPEFDKDGNNTAFAEIPPIGSIKMDDTLYIVPNTPGSFEVLVESSIEGNTDINLIEMLPSEKEPLLKDNMTYDSTEKKSLLKQKAEGDTVLRVAHQIQRPIRM